MKAVKIILFAAGIVAMFAVVASNDYNYFRTQQQQAEKYKQELESYFRRLDSASSMQEQQSEDSH